MLSIRSLRLKIFLLFFSGISTMPHLLSAQIMMGARNLSLGQATTALPDNDWALFGNPALVVNEHISAGFYGLRNYGFSELTDMAAFGSMPTRLGVLSAGFHRYGDQLFSESRIRMGYKNNWKELNFGLVINYNHLAIGGGYGSGGAIGIDAGIAAVITDDLWIGAKAVNLNYPVYQGIDEDLPRNLSIGLSYKPEERAVFVLDMLKDVRFPISWRGGVEVELIEGIHGRIGITTEPITYSGGFGYRSSKWKINLAIQKHQLLGFSPGMDLILCF